MRAHQDGNKRSARTARVIAQPIVPSIGCQEGPCMRAGFSSSRLLHKKDKIMCLHFWNICHYTWEEKSNFSKTTLYILQISSNSVCNKNWEQWLNHNRPVWFETLLDFLWGYVKNKVVMFEPSITKENMKQRIRLRFNDSRNASKN